MTSRRIFGFILISTGLSVFIYYGLFIFTSSTVDQAIRRNRDIEMAFQEAANFVDNYTTQNKTLPSQAEFSHRPGADRYPISGSITLNSCAEELPEKFGKPDEPNSYFLGYWRGEWCEFFIAWNAQTSLKFEKDDYFPFHSYKLTWLCFCLSVAALISGLYLTFRNCPI